MRSPDAQRLIAALHAGLAERYTPEQRGKGVGPAVLAALEAEARNLGATRLVLETGIHQEAAIGLYRRAGFTSTDCWGEYLTSSTSVCFEKPPA